MYNTHVLLAHAHTQPVGGGKARRVALIKEWRDVMAEVGDHQSLVASLRQSAYYHLFKVLLPPTFMICFAV